MSSISLNYQSKIISRLISNIKVKQELCTYYSSSSSSSSGGGSSNNGNKKSIRTEQIRFINGKDDNNNNNSSNNNELVEISQQQKHLQQDKQQQNKQIDKREESNKEIQQLTKDLQEKAKLLPSTSSPLSDPTKSALYEMMNYQKVMPIVGKRKKHLYDFNTASVDPVIFFFFTKYIKFKTSCRIY